MTDFPLLGPFKTISAAAAGIKEYEMSRKTRKEWEEADEFRAHEAEEHREDKRMERLIESGKYKLPKEPLEIPFVANFPKWLR